MKLKKILNELIDIQGNINNESEQHILWKNGKLFINEIPEDLNIRMGSIHGFLDSGKKTIKMIFMDDYSAIKYINNIQKCLQDLIRAKLITGLWDCIIENKKLTKQSLGSTKVKNIINFNTDFDKIIPICFHGTNSWFAEDIKKDGILPQKYTKNKNWTKGYNNNSPNLIYLTIDYDRAKYYAEESVESFYRKTGMKTKPVIFKIENLPTSMVSVDDDYLNKDMHLAFIQMLKTGKSSYKDSYISSIRSSSQFAVNYNIPKSMIKIVK